MTPSPRASSMARAKLWLEPVSSNGLKRTSPTCWTRRAGPSSLERRRPSGQRATWMASAAIRRAGIEVVSRASASRSARRVPACRALRMSDAHRAQEQASDDREADEGERRRRVRLGHVASRAMDARTSTGGLRTRWTRGRSRCYTPAVSKKTRGGQPHATDRPGQGPPTTATERADAIEPRAQPVTTAEVIAEDIVEDRPRGCQRARRRAPRASATHHRSRPSSSSPPRRDRVRLRRRRTSAGSLVVAGS